MSGKEKAMDYTITTNHVSAPVRAQVLGLIPVARATRGVVATARGNLTNSRTSFITKDTPIFPHIELTIARINQSKERERERERETERGGQSLLVFGRHPFIHGWM